MPYFTRFIALLVFLGSTAGLAHAQCYRLVWADEFDGSSLDEDKWSYQIGNGCPSLCGWGNNELQYYREENVEVSGGTLKIHVRDETFGGSDYTSARIRTKDKAAWTYGRFEARMKMPSGGQGYWPAFWMLSEEDHYGTWPLSGEIDIMEMVGQTPNKVTGTVHYGPLSPNNRWLGDNYFLPSGSLDDGFHLYAIEWEEDEIRWYLDGVLYATRNASELYPDPWRFDRDFHLLLNCAVGGWFPGPPDGSTSFPDTLEVDYVRIFQDVDKTAISGRGSVLAQTDAEPYYVQSVDGATYSWSVPAGASVASGGASPEANINWGSGGGTVTVSIDAPTCSTSISREIQVLDPDCAETLIDHENTPLIFPIGSDGTYLANEPNPDSDTVNASATVGRYARNGSVSFDALRYVVDALSDAGKLETGELVFEMDVYSIAPPGTRISLNLENTAESFGPYPNGRHSFYGTVTSVQNAWERVRFTHEGSPDPTVGNGEVNQLLLLFQPGSSANDVFWFDNLAVVDPACAASPIGGQVVAPQWRIYPNPSRGMLRLEGTTPNALTRVLDAAGRVLRQLRYTAGSAIDLRSFPAGHYLIEVETETGLRQRQSLILVD